MEGSYGSLSIEDAEGFDPVNAHLPKHMSGPMSEERSARMAQLDILCDEALRNPTNISPGLNSRISREVVSCAMFLCRFEPIALSNQWISVRTWNSVSPRMRDSKIWSDSLYLLHAPEALLI